MIRIFTLLSFLLCANLASAQCAPAPTFSVISSRAINQPLRLKASITTGSPAWPQTHNHYINWGDGNARGSSIGGDWYHNYSSPGTYTIKYYLSKVDSTTSTTLCYDSTSQSISVAYCSGAATIIAYHVATGQVNFTASSLSGVTTGITYTWDFGDGNTATGSFVSHTYTNLSPKTVTLYGQSSTCTDTASITVNPLHSCAGKTADFSTAFSGTQVSFTNLSTNTTGATTYNWNFGDGNTSTLVNPTHTYTSGGLYAVQLVTKWDSLCSATRDTLILVDSAHWIHGYIYSDSSMTPYTPNYKVWLITFDSAANTLTAVDSLLLMGAPGSGTQYYQFSNVLNGAYRVKAVITNNPSSGTGVVPTYSTSALSWSNATVVNNAGGPILANIVMQSGTLTSGPGFVGGSISMGANKCTGLGVPNIDVYLLDATTDALVKAAKTDVNGDYTFTNVPLGMYKIQPEWMGFTTTPSAPFTISSSKTKVENMWFIASNTRKTIKPVPASVMNVAEGVSFSIYPNPAKNKTTISWNSNSTADAAIVITDIAGKKVYSNTVKAAGQTELDLSQLEKGLYFINISSGNTQQTQKLVVE